MATITICNDRSIITSTNYWESEHAAAGYAYLSLNAGCYRLLMPPEQDPLIQDITTSRIESPTRGGKAGSRSTPAISGRQSGSAQPSTTAP